MAYDVKLDTGRRVVIYNSTGPVYYSEIYAPNITGFAKVVRTTKSNSYGKVTGNVAGEAIPAPATAETQFYVRLHLVDGSHEDIALGDLAGFPTWTNNETGFEAACADIAVHAAT